MARIAAVLLPLPLPEAFDYAEPEGMDLRVGDHVAVPLGPRMARGVVSSLRDGAGHNRPLKPVDAKLDAPSLPPSVVAFVHWAANYAVESPGYPLAMALRGLRSPPPRPIRQTVATGTAPARPTAARAKVLEVLSTSPAPLAPPDLARAAGVSSGVIKGLIDEGVLRVETVAAPDGLTEPDLTRPATALNIGQLAAVDALKANAAKSDFSVTLLDGVTGSGKTEVYMELAASVLAADPTAQVLVLLPEIALTQAALDRIEQRFGARPAEWHSAVPPPKRRQVWEAVATGRARIVAGARSALFLPYANLKLIVVDEEHDASYKQEEGFIYHARDLAVARAKLAGAQVVLASATPSLESLHNAQTGRYEWLRLNARHGAAQLPDVTLIDLRETPPERDRWLSRPLVEAMAETFGRGEQSLLFLNRRGYAPLVLCRACGERMRAPDTDSWLVEHRYTGRLVCHLTGFSMPKPDKCPHCGARDSLVSVGPGVERVEEEVRERFPQARVAVFSSDTVMHAQGARTLIEAMTAGEIDVLVATQAAAKGHDFPNLTLVGIVDADLGLRGGDLRAAERTFQLLAQASGRAGRRATAGRAMIQSFAPDHGVMQALAMQDRDAFTAAELDARQAAGLPPYGRLAALIVSSEDAAVLETYVAALAAAVPNAPDLEVFGPADAPLGLVRGRRRKRFLVRADRNVDLQAFLAAWRSRVKIPGAVRLTIDVDPHSFL